MKHEQFFEIMNGHTQDDAIARKLIALGVGVVVIGGGVVLLPEFANEIRAGMGAVALGESIRQSILLSERIDKKSDNS